jgi:hypothetical protein
MSVNFLQQFKEKGAERDSYVTPDTCIAICNYNVPWHFKDIAHMWASWFGAMF